MCSIVMTPMGRPPTGAPPTGAPPPMRPMSMGPPPGLMQGKTKTRLCQTLSDIPIIVVLNQLEIGMPPPGMGRGMPPMRPPPGGRGSSF